MKRAKEIREQLVGICERVEIDVNDPSLSDYSENQFANIQKCVLSGYFYNVARLSDTDNQYYKTIKNPHTVLIHPTSFLFKKKIEWVVYHEIVFTSKEYMRSLIPIEKEWLVEVAPHFYKKEDIQSPNKKKKR